MNTPKSNNPFYGLKSCLTLCQKATISQGDLDNAWIEVCDDKTKREMFFSLLFSIGDVTNRQHNIFKGKKIDNGGNANRNSFQTILQWMWKNDEKQFTKFLFAHLFNEYTCFDALFKSRVKTIPGSSKIQAIESVFSDDGYSRVLLEYVYSIINGNNPFDKMLVAKFLTIPRISKRQGHKKMLPETKHIMQKKLDFLYELSSEMNWDIRYLKGYREWRKQYNGDLESVLFSTGKINDFSKDEFILWFDKIPALARTRVKTRIFKSDKWTKFRDWIDEWETYKVKKQEEQRILEEKIRQGQASEEDKTKLAEVKKEAKINTGAINFKDLYESILDGTVDKLALESFVQNKVNLPYNSLVIIDDSGSMRGEPFNFAKFIASVCLVKNPDDDARNLIGFFNSDSHWHSFIDETSDLKNSVFRRKITKINPEPLVDGTLSFFENYQRISKFCDAVYEGGCTYLDSIPRDLKNMVEKDPEFLDVLKTYPVWTIISDGDLNSSHNAHQSMLDFQRDCKSILGYVPFVVMIEISGNNSPVNYSFEGIENFIYVPSNPAQIEQFLTNFKDMDSFDVYMPLLSLYRSNRYELVRANTL